MKYHDRLGRFYVKPADREVKQRTSVRGVCITNGAVLVVMPAGGLMWEVPGGGQEDRESQFETLKREMWEETGYTIYI